jgi:hypothetical protein
VAKKNSRKQQKSMKRVYKIVVALLGVAMLSSCSVNMDIEFGPGGGMPPDEENAQGDYVASFGTLVLQPLYILTDEGKELSVVEMAPTIGWNELESVVEGGGRALFNYTILSSQALNQFAVRLNKVSEIFIEDINFYDSGTVGGVESMLIHPAMPYQATYSGGYVNVNVYYNSSLSPLESRPDISLNCDLATSTDDTLMLQLRYQNQEWNTNPYGPLQSAWFSFRMPEEYLERAELANIFAFQWCWWISDSNYGEGIDKGRVSIMYTDSYTEGGRLAILPDGL